MIFRYQLWGHQIISDCDLGGVDAAAEDGSPLDSLRIESVPQDAAWLHPQGEPLLEDSDNNGNLWFACWKHDDGYVIQFPEFCSFLILPGQMRIEYFSLPHTDNATLAHLILDHAVPRLFSAKPGYIVLHSCSVEINGRVIAVLGLSGQGKSTLAGFLASQGCPVLTDDCLVIRWEEARQQWLAQPSYQSVRLWPDSVDALGIDRAGLHEFAYDSSKRRTGKDADLKFASKGAPLRGCFLLASSEVPHSGPPEARALSVNEAFVALIGAVFRVDPENAEINSREFDVLTSLTSSVPCWSLAYEREYRWLPAVQQTIIRALQARPE